jgi:hypothetical protein
MPEHARPGGVGLAEDVDDGRELEEVPVRDTYVEKGNFGLWRHSRHFPKLLRRRPSNSTANVSAVAPLLVYSVGVRDVLNDLAPQRLDDSAAVRRLGGIGTRVVDEEAAQIVEA